MRWRTKKLCKLFIIFCTLAIALIIILSIIAKHNRTDSFISILKEKSSASLTNNNLKASRRLLNLSNFEFLIENNLCQEYEKELLAIIIVTSYVGHDALRAVHREAISQKKLSELGMQRVFLLAAIPKEERLITQKQLLNEQEKFGDLLQGNFVEAYRNLSYKHIMGLQWAATECNKANFIIKIDDDIIYDIYHDKRYLETLKSDKQSTSYSKLLAGYVLDAKPVIRNQASKWYVTEEEYAGNVYPPYVSGWFYITNPSTALSLIEQSKRSAIFWIDDTWVTGMLREPLGITLTRLNSWFSTYPLYLHCCVRDLKKANMECDYFVGPNGGDSKLLVNFLHNVKKCYYGKCRKRTKETKVMFSCGTSIINSLFQHSNPGKPKVKEVKLR